LFDDGVLSIENFIESKATKPFVFTFKFETKMDKYLKKRINFEEMIMHEKIKKVIVGLDVGGDEELAKSIINQLG
jgi:hypothetical protein